MWPTTLVPLMATPLSSELRGERWKTGAGERCARLTFDCDRQQYRQATISRRTETRERHSKIGTQHNGKRNSKKDRKGKVVSSRQKDNATETLVKTQKQHSQKAHSTLNAYQHCFITTIMLFRRIDSTTRMLAQHSPFLSNPMLHVLILIHRHRADHVHDTGSLLHRTYIAQRAASTAARTTHHREIFTQYSLMHTDLRPQEKKHIKTQRYMRLRAPFHRTIDAPMPIHLTPDVMTYLILLLVEMLRLHYTSLHYTSSTSHTSTSTHMSSITFTTFACLQHVGSR